MAAPRAEFDENHHRSYVRVVVVDPQRIRDSTG
jgi:hypothetical protein